MQNYDKYLEESLQDCGPTVYFALKLNINQVKMMSDYDIPPHYYKYIPLFEDYLCLRAHGYKKAYILTKLVEDYNISESTVKRVIKALSQRVTL